MPSPKAAHLLSGDSTTPGSRPSRAPAPLSCLLQDERERIEALGGFVSHMDCWRVNGTLAVSRAIGEEARAGGHGFPSPGLLTPRGHGLAQLFGRRCHVPAYRVVPSIRL